MFSKRKSKVPVGNVLIEEIYVLEELKPKTDEIFLYLMERSLEGAIPVYFANIPIPLVQKFDQGFRPEYHDVGQAAIEQVMSDWEEGFVNYVWVYPRSNRYIQSDDYITFAAALRGEADYLPCMVMGPLTVPGAISVHGPLNVDDIKKSLDLVKNEHSLLWR